MVVQRDFVDDAVPAAILIGALLAAIYLVRSGKARAAAAGKTPPPGTSPGTLRIGQFAVQPGASWLVLTPATK